MNATACLVYMTCPDLEEARNLARGLLEARLAAGVNIIPGAHSLYWWKGSVREKGECLLLAQTSSRVRQELERFVSSRHSYETPCICVLSIDALPASLADWIEQNVQSAPCE